MKPNRETASVSDQRLSRLLRLGVLVLAVGVLAFAGVYYQDQHVNAGPSLLSRQTDSAEQAVRKAPTNIGVRLQLAAAYRQGKRYDDALTQYDEILKADGTNRAAILGRGGALMATGDLTAAATAYRKITGAAATGEFAGADPQLEEAHYYLGSIAVTQGKSKVAVTELQAAVKIDGSDSDALYLLGVARLRDGAPQLAVDSLKQALLFVPTGWCEPYSQLAQAYAKLGRLPQATYARAMTDFCHQKTAAATRQLKTLTAGPVAVDAMLGLALIAESESSNAEAASWLKKVLTVDATNVTAKSALSQLGVGPTPGPKSSPTTQGRS